MEETVPIQTLAPDAELPSNGAIRAVVTLAWPFSSSTRQCALLLADPDFRLRTRKGQVRVRFTGPSAEAVAKSRIGIGDEIRLHLGGATWAESKEGAIRTPGKSVDGELVFARQLELKVARGTGEANISLDAPPSPQKPTHDYTEAATSTPLPKAVRHLRSSWHESGVPIYSSPAFAKRIRLSGDSFSSSAFDPFVEDREDSDEQASKKLRTSFGSVSQWRYAGRSPSPPKDTPGFDLQAELDRQDAEDRAQLQDAVMSQSGHDEEAPSQATKRDTIDPEAETSSQEHASPIPAAEPPKTLSNDGVTIGDLPNLQDQTSQLFAEMPPPPLPRSRTNELTQASNLARSQSPATPELRAVPNSGLPLPSPFPAEGSQAHYFEQHQEPGVPKVSSQLGEERMGDAIVEQQTLTTELNPVDASDTGVTEKDAPKPDSSSNGISQVESQQGAVEIESQKPLSSAAKGKSQRDKILQSELDPPVPPSPRPTVATPVKLPPNIFSLDGAGTTASNFNTPAKESRPTPGSTPQSQRDKVMRQTFKSLFGIQTSPEPETEAQSPVPQRSEQQPEQLRTEDVKSRFGGRKDFDSTASSTLGQAAPEQQTTSTQAAPERQEDKQTQVLERDDVSESLPFNQVGTHGEAKSTQDAEIFAEKERQQSISEPQGVEILQDQASSIFAQKREDVEEVAHTAETPSKTSLVGQTFPASQPHLRSSTAVETVASHQKPPSSSAPAVIRLDSSSDVDPENTAERDDQHQDSAPKAESPDTNAAQQVDEGVKAARSPSSTSAEMPKQSMLSGRFPRDRVIEDSQDELPTLLNTQAAPTMDEDEVTSNEKKTQAPVLEEDEVEELQDLAEAEADVSEHQMERQIQSASVASDEEMEDAHAEFEDAADVEDEPMDEGPLNTLDDQVHPPLTTEHPVAEPVDVHGGSVDAGVKENDVRRDDEAQPSQKPTQFGVIELDSSSPAPQIEPVSSVFDTEARPSESLQELVTEEVESDFGTQLRSEEPTQSAAAPDDRITEKVVEDSIADDRASLKEAIQLPSESLAGVELKTSGSSIPSVHPLSPLAMQETSQQLETQIPLTNLSEPVKENVADVNASVTNLVPSATPEPSQQSETRASVTRAQGGMEEPVARQEHAETSEFGLSKTQDAKDLDNSALLTQQTQAKVGDMNAADRSELHEDDGVEKHKNEAAAEVEEIATSKQQDAAGLETGLSTVTAGKEPRTPASAMLRQPEQDLAQPAHAQANVQTPIQSSKRKSTPRKSLSARLSHVPDVISAWFSPRRSFARTDVFDSSSAAQQPKEDVLPRPTQEETDTPVSDAAQTSAAAKMPQLTHTKSNGILTSMGYYTPLSRLEEYLNPANQGTNTVEIIAVVSDSTRKPERAKGGPKDYFTIFRTTEPSKSPASSVRVEVFRPWKAKLPVAEVGDVILLRGFIVKSRKRKPYLLSTDASGWCVWRYAEFMRSESHTDSLSSSSVREEVTGPPVELSEAERSHVRTLREWWLSTHPVEEGRGGEQGSDGPAEGETEHEDASGITARL
ncbi:hypothetical protein KC340_g9523 [Hortaea werneckii]|nr:hypothetical protein KC342_g7489 [Hortaea werneckii]KAI7098469.1 hypothetical protein KC339_g8945 [Hortaea werneckii]KAI7232989.1 hypothetical protein KC365_g6546 [Hortaea werneckii]KAI7313614.1 hypothetical protein KC340_g9523 [Hortaea werneckii]KAI7391191.1 hypothetical protein KC328_g7597 [Hortaea werneckii]